MALPTFIQNILNVSEGARQYASGAISEADMEQIVGSNPLTPIQAQPVQPQPTAAQPVQPQAQPTSAGITKAFSEFSPQEQIAIRDIAGRMGFEVPAGVANGQIVDAAGNPIAGAPSLAEFGNMVGQLKSGVHINDILGGSTQQQAMPQTGLAGSEAALQGGLSGATGAMLTGAEMARGDIAGSGQQAQDILQTGKEQATNIALRAQEMGADPLRPFLQGGQQASQLQAALSGALGAGAQAQAFKDFNESPGQSFLREQAERGLLRNQAAIGGLGGGRVRQELQRQAMGLAQQDFQNQFNRLGQVAGQGLQAGGQISGLTGQLGSNLMGQFGALTGQGAGLAGQQGQQLANIAQQTGMGVGQAMLGTGQQLAADRLLTGQQLAANIGGTSSNLANLANQYGMGVSDLLGSTGGNLAQLLQGTGQNLGQSQQQLAGLLQNTYLAQGGQVAGLPGVPGVQQTQGSLMPALQGAGAVFGGLGGLMTGLSAG